MPAPTIDLKPAPAQAFDAEADMPRARPPLEVNLYCHRFQRLIAGSRVIVVQDARREIRVGGVVNIHEVDHHPDQNRQGEVIQTGRHASARVAHVGKMWAGVANDRVIVEFCDFSLFGGGQ